MSNKFPAAGHVFGPSTSAPDGLPPATHVSDLAVEYGGLVNQTEHPEPCESCGQRVITAQAGDRSRLFVVEMADTALPSTPWPIWSPTFEHTPERCRACR